MKVTEEQNVNNEEEDFDYDYSEGVFTDNEGTEALRASAQALGIDPDRVAPKPKDDEEGPQYRYFASKNCKHCYGRGVLTVCISPSRQKVFWKNEGLPGRLSHRNKNLSTKKLGKPKRRQFPGPSRPKRKQITNVSVGNDLGQQWNTQQSEPLKYKEDNTTKAFCRCIRAVEA
jgi:hypothetical protein